MSNFKDNIKFLRIREGEREQEKPYSQAKFAELLGANRANIDSYETKGVLPKQAFLDELKKVFGINIDMMLNMKMNDANYDSFFGETPETAPTIEIPEKYDRLVLLQLIVAIKDCESHSERSKLAEQVLALVSRLESEKEEIKDDFMSFLKDMKSFSK